MLGISPQMKYRVVSAALAACVLAACNGGGEEPVFPADYKSTYQEVRDCRFSIDHDLTRMRVLASPDALAVYQARNAPFPVGAVVLKEIYDSADMTCSGEILHIAVMQKLEEGAAPDALNWTWQKVSAKHETMSTDLMRCIGCHTGCGKPPGGHDGTCTEP